MKKQRMFIVTKTGLQQIAREGSTFPGLGRDLTEAELTKVVVELRKSINCPVRYYSKR
jgi:hypothetical protein